MVWVLVPVYYGMPQKGDMVHRLIGVYARKYRRLMDNELRQYLEAWKSG